MATAKTASKVAKKATAKKPDSQISIITADERVTIARLIDVAITANASKIYTELKQIGVAKSAIFNKLPADTLLATINVLLANGVVNLTVYGAEYIKNGKVVKKPTKKTAAPKLDIVDASSETPVVSKATLKKAAEKGVAIIKKSATKKPAKPGIPAKPKKVKTAAVTTAANISLTVLELEARINAVEGVGATPRLIVLRRPADAIMNSIGVQNSAYTNDARPALPSRTLDALNARLGALNLRPTEWFIRNLY